MKIKTKMLVIAKNDFPLEIFLGNSFRIKIINFIRRIFLSHHKECHKCYEKRKGLKVN